MIATRTVLLTWILTALIVPSSGEGQYAQSKDGVQRLPDEMFSHHPVQLPLWQKENQKFFAEHAGDILMMLVVFHHDSTETLAVIERRELSKEPFASAEIAPLIGHTLIVKGSAQGTSKGTSREIVFKDLEPTLKHAWKLVAGAEIDTQFVNMATDRNEFWYLLATNVDETKRITSSLHVAQGINPPPSGILRKIRSDLLSLPARK